MMIKFPQLNNFLTCPALLKLEGRVTKHTNLIARWNLHQCIDKLNINLLKLKKDAFQKEILKRETLWGKNSPAVVEKGTELLTEVDEAVGDKQGILFGNYEFRQ